MCPAKDLVIEEWISALMVAGWEARWAKGKCIVKLARSSGIVCVTLQGGHTDPLCMRFCGFGMEAI